ncbi:PREDICTED: uncharacterized protein LOC109584257 [Amphimedon queenslandica]|uniref:THAP-type domain-containing protein n=1 Tax=Amphimedon queenslandica TaxID=400682 RepID=A0A1X7U990_AMPQE|nr:PREDICTED: uncharacterized protein LOC109584257 [Amphimedon queenslandica]|eukprot:XP_019855499.1 PREDICTED: uncharacterized protein LOC109584257 [Amphimedon queenslandica]
MKFVVMPYCCAVNCNNRSKKGLGISFFCFPTDPAKRERWIAAIKRDNWSPSEYSRVCSRHFVTGKHSDDPRHVDYAPSIFHYNARADTEDHGAASMERYHRAVKRARNVAVPMTNGQCSDRVTRNAATNQSQQSDTVVNDVCDFPICDIDFGEISSEEDNIAAGVETNRDSGSELGDIPDEDKSTLSESEDDFEEHEWFDDSFNDEDSNDEKLDNDSSDNDEQLPVAEIEQNQDNHIVFLEKDLAESEYEICSLQLDNELSTQSNEEIQTHCSSLSALVQSQAQQILQLKTMYLRSVRESIALRGNKFDASILINDDEKAVLHRLKI